MSATQPRTSWQVTRSVWYAMFMREAVSRTMADRMGWFWMIIEPVAMLTIMLFIRSLIGGTNKLIIGADFIPWTIVGLMGFFMVREGLSRSQGSIESSRALFAYRQVQPIDTVLVRSFVDSMLRTLVFMLFIVGGLGLGLEILPDNGVYVLFVWLSLWSLGLGLGLVVSVIGTLIPEANRIIKVISLPLLLISGALFPFNALPKEIVDLLIFNPIVHGLELIRLGFFENYRVVAGTSAVYLWLWILALNALGLLMHLRYRDQLKAK